MVMTQVLQYSLLVAYLLSLYSRGRLHMSQIHLQLADVLLYNFYAGRGFLALNQRKGERYSVYEVACTCE